MTTRVNVSDWLRPGATVAEISVFDAEDCEGTTRICVAVYSGPTTTHLRMTLAEVALLVDALEQTAAMVAPIELVAA